MVDLLTESTPRAAKPHLCYDCGRTIAKGERHSLSVCRNDGSVYRLRSHEDCRAAALDYISHGYPPDYEDGVDPLAEMIAAGGGQDDLDAMRGDWPHVVCRIELGWQLSEIARETRLAEWQASRIAAE